MTFFIIYTTMVVGSLGVAFSIWTILDTRRRCCSK